MISKLKMPLKRWVDLLKLQKMACNSITLYSHANNISVFFSIEKIRLGKDPPLVSNQIYHKVCCLHN